MGGGIHAESGEGVQQIDKVRQTLSGDHVFQMFAEHHRMKAMQAQKAGVYLTPYKLRDTVVVVGVRAAVRATNSSYHSVKWTNEKVDTDSQPWLWDGGSEKSLS